MKNLSYLLGVLRDGSLPTCREKAEVTLAADYSRDWLVMIAKMASVEFSIPLKRFKIYKVWANKSKRYCFRLKVYSKELYELLLRYYPAGSQIYWKTPAVVKTSFENRLAYLAGFYDAEGGCRNAERFVNGFTKSFQCWCSIRCKHYFSPNEPLLFLKNVLQGMNVTSSIYDSDELVLTGIKNIKRFYTLVPLKHQKKKKDLENMILFSEACSAEA